MSDDPKVTRLPTAVRRKVRQPPHRERRALAGQLDECPAEYLAPWVRKLLADREPLQGTAAEGLKDSAAPLIALALLANADPIVKAKVFGQVAHFHDIYRTAETERALHLVEPMLKAFRPPSGAA